MACVLMRFIIALFRPACVEKMFFCFSLISSQGSLSDFWAKSKTTNHSLRHKRILSKSKFRGIEVKLIA